MVSAVLSAAAGLILKVESIITDDKVERHRNPLFRWCRAIDYALIAEADLERVGYVFLEKRTVAAPRTYFAEISDILLMRHVSIVGGKDNPHDSEVGDGDAQ